MLRGQGGQALRLLCDTVRFPKEAISDVLDVSMTDGGWVQTVDSVASNCCTIRRRPRNQRLARVLQWSRGSGREGYEGRPKFPIPNRLLVNSQEETHTLGCSKCSVLASTKRCSKAQRPEVGSVSCHHCDETKIMNVAKGWGTLKEIRDFVKRAVTDG